MQMVDKFDNTVVEGCGHGKKVEDRGVLDVLTQANASHMGAD